MGISEIIPRISISYNSYSNGCLMQLVQFFGIIIIIAV